ncbi:MAG: hypothetical protein FWC38_07390 [Proteobacteria bacterium]|nr:hypothetical protein [Pseudomonadota bacterium]MCL2308027.1 hypothetical protein [Pseudomonadota bacterium]
MKSFFDWKYRFAYIAGAAFFVAGCAVSPVAPEQEQKEETPPSVVDAPTPEEALTAPSIEDAERDAAAASEEAQLRKQLEDHARFQKLLEDLARYWSLGAEEAQRTQTELSNRIAGAQGGENGNRVRLAYLLSLHPSGLGDQRALLMLETVTKSERASASLRHLASILRAQIQEKQRALQKLDALRDVDRLLLEERMPDSKALPSRTPSRRP